MTHILSLLLALKIYLTNFSLYAFEDRIVTPVGQTRSEIPTERSSIQRSAKQDQKPEVTRDIFRTIALFLSNFNTLGRWDLGMSAYYVSGSTHLLRFHIDPSTSC